jgi:hypothetical protein
MTIALYAFSELDGSMIALTSINEFLVAVHALNRQHAIPIDTNCVATLSDTKPCSLIDHLLGTLDGRS